MTFATTTWTANKVANWNDTANWSIAVPNGVDDQAMLGGAITAAHTIYADQPVTLGTLSFNNANTYVFAGSASLTMQMSSGSALIEARAGTQKINLPLTLASNTTLSVLPGATLVIADPMTIRPGVTLTQTGGGTVSYLSTISVPTAARVAFGGDASVSLLSLAPGSTAAAAEVGRSFVSIDRLSIAGGAQFDLGGSVLALSNASTLDVRAMIDSDRIVSGTVDDSDGAATILVLDAAMLAGESPSIDPRFLSFASGTLAVPAYVGDVDLDGTVTQRDLQIIRDHLGNFASSDTGWFIGDVNRDGHVDSIDAQMTFANLGLTVVPEPCTVLLLFAACPLRTRRPVAKRSMIVGIRHVSPVFGG